MAACTDAGRNLIKVAVLGAAGLIAMTLPAAAQSTAEGQGGIQLTFGIAQRLQTNDNLDLDVVSLGRTHETSTRLSFGLLTETRNSRFYLDATARIRAANGPAITKSGFEVSSPQIALGYSRSSVSSTFSLDASLRETDLAQDAEVTDFDNNTGIRRDTDLSTALNWGEDRRLGFGLSAGWEVSDYSAAAGQADTRRTRVGASVRMDLSTATLLTLDATRSQFREDGVPGLRDTNSLGAALTLERPDGAFTLRGTVTDTEDGTQTALSFGRSLDLPLGRLALTVGASRGTTGKTYPTADISYNQTLPRGALTASLSRSIGAATDDDSEQLSTRASLGLTHQIGPRSDVRFDLSWAENEETATGLATANGSFGATLTQALTEDWALDVGYRHRLRNEDGVGRSRDNGVFLEVKRTFSTRF